VIVMIEQLEQQRDNAIRWLPWATIAFVIGWGMHGLDHLRRGMSASPPFIMGAGMVQGLLVVLTVSMVVMDRPRAPLAAILLGFGSAVGFTYAHLLPTFLPGYQDSFISLPRTNVTWFSWFSALAEIATALVFAIVGMREVNRDRRSVL
jgi:uncharacterized membrane protein YhdT